MSLDWQRLQSGFRNVGNNITAAFAPLFPYVGQAAVCMSAYTAGLAAAQGTGMVLRVSCATPVLGPVGGVLGVGFASALAGQASIKCRQFFADGMNPLQDPLRGVKLQDILVDTAFGIVLFKVMGGRFRSVMPSNLAKVGAIARESLPAAGVEYASDANRRELLRMYRRDGCHHCGTRRNRGVIGDHMPPNKHVKAYLEAGKKSLLKMRWTREAASALGIQVGPPRQRYYPQCVSCSQRQSSAIRNNRTVLVFHEVLHHGGKATAWHYAGTLVGLRHYSSSGEGGGAVVGGGQRPLRRQ